MAFVVLACCVVASGCQTTQNYDDCILEHVTESMDGTAVAVVVNACRNKYPDQSNAEPVEGEERPSYDTSGVTRLGNKSVAELAGRSGPLSGATSLGSEFTFGGTIYNGMADTIVTAIGLRISTEIGGERTAKRYFVDDLSLLPYRVGKYRVEILPGDENATYSWDIEAAWGAPYEPE